MKYCFVIIKKNRLWIFKFIQRKGANNLIKFVVDEYSRFNTYKLFR